MNRFYDRQFITRNKANSRIVSRFEKELYSYFSADVVTSQSTVAYFGDLIKKHTGMSAQEIITHRIIDESKRLLSATSDDINIIAYRLGFQYPQHFTRLFKRITGYSPTQFRSQIANS